MLIRSFMLSSVTIHITIKHGTQLQEQPAQTIFRARRQETYPCRPPRHRARLNASTSPEDMNLPGLRLHPLRGNYQGFWSVTVQANWRVIFRFDAGDAVDYLDYHER